MVLGRASQGVRQAAHQDLKSGHAGDPSEPSDPRVAHPLQRIRSSRSASASTTAGLSLERGQVRERKGYEDY